MPAATRHRELHADHAGRCHQDRLGGASHRGSGEARHFTRVAETVLACARVGAAAVDDDGRRASPGRTRCSRDTRMGAACATLVVKTAAAEASVSLTSSDMSG